MVLEINGVDIVPYIAFEGLEWSRNDVDGPNAGRAMDGTMIRDRVGVKDKWNVKCIPLNSSDKSMILQLLAGEWLTVRYLSPQTNTIVTKTMYTNNVTTGYQIKRASGEEIWKGISFPLIER